MAQARHPADHPVHAVVFDVGRVIVEWDMRVLFARLFDDPAEADWFHRNVVTEAWHAQHDAGRPLGVMIAERVRAFPEYRAQIEAYRDRWLETVPGMVPGTSELIERLSDRKIPLYAITNFGSDFWRIFRPTAPILQRFHDIVVSGDENVWKPGSAIFALAAERFGHAPETMLFIDNSLANIEAADRLGWQTHHFADAAGLADCLTRRGLL